MFSDIEFISKLDGKRYVVMSFNDRTGHQVGQSNLDTLGNLSPYGGGQGYVAVSSGDILIAQIHENGTATLESGGSVGGSVASVDQVNNDSQYCCYFKKSSNRKECKNRPICGY